MRIRYLFRKGRITGACAAKCNSAQPYTQPGETQKTNSVRLNHEADKSAADAAKGGDYDTASDSSLVDTGAKKLSETSRSLSAVNGSNKEGGFPFTQNNKVFHTLLVFNTAFKLILSEF